MIPDVHEAINKTGIKSNDNTTIEKSHFMVDEMFIFVLQRVQAWYKVMEYVVLGRLYL